MIYKAIAPGRVNLIGEHTDYNQGFVLPMAISLAIKLTGEKNPALNRNITAYAKEYNDEQTFSLDHLRPLQGDPGWIDYIRSVCWALEDQGCNLEGATLKIESNIPVGAGLSSSAALELATAGALAAANGCNFSLAELALLCQKAENEFVGVQCGIMDQYAVALGQENRALFLDCRNLAYELIPLELKDHQLLVVDSRVERALSSSAYNRRREECEEAVQKLAVIHGKNFQALRDVSLDQIEAAKSKLSGVLYKRSLYVIEENNRVNEAVTALKAGALDKFGYLMVRSHAGLRDLYEVSCPELDLIVDIAMQVDGVLGARMTGAGFGGCALVLLEKKAVDYVKAQIKAAFAALNWRNPNFYLTSAVNGLSVEKL